MPLTLRKGNPDVVRVILELKKAARAHGAPLWGAVAERLTRPRHQVLPLNVGHLERLAQPREMVVVPGKLLASGRLTKPVTVAAIGYSQQARSKIHAAGGSALTITELVKSHPDGKGVRLLA